MDYQSMVMAIIALAWRFRRDVIARSAKQHVQIPIPEWLRRETVQPLPASSRDSCDKGLCRLYLVATNLG
jgi:hypothetical protein